MRALQGEAEQLHSLCAPQEGAAAPNPGPGALWVMENVGQGMGRVLRSSWELEQLSWALAMPRLDFGDHLTSMEIPCPSLGYPAGAAA